MADFEETQEGLLRATTGTTVAFNHSPGCIYESITTLHYGGNLSIYSPNFNAGTSQFSQGPPSVKVQQFDAIDQRELNSSWSFSLNTGEEFRAFLIEPQCSIPAQGPRVTIGQNNLEAIDWPPTGNDPNYGAQLMFLCQWVEHRWCNTTRTVVHQYVQFYIVSITSSHRITDELFGKFNRMPTA